MASISFLKFAAAIMELLEPGQFLKPAKPQSSVQSTQNSAVTISQTNVVISSTLEPKASITEEAGTVDAIAEHITQQFTQFDNSKDVIALTIENPEQTPAPANSFQNPLVNQVEATIQSFVLTVTDEITVEPLTAQPVNKTVPLVEIPTASLENQADLSATQIIVEPLLPESASWGTNSVEPATSTDTVLTTSETSLLINAAQSAQKTISSDKISLNEADNKAVSDAASIVVQAAEKTILIHETTIEKVNSSLLSNQTLGLVELQTVPPSIKEVIAQPEFISVDLQPPINAAQPLSIKLNEEAVSAEREATFEPTSFWDLYRDIDESEIKYLGAVIYLYNYMTARALTDFLNPAIEIHERQSVMTTVSSMANSNMAGENRVQETVQKGVDENEERLRNEKREFLENSRRLQAEMMLRQRVERQKFEERIHAQKAKEAKESDLLGK